MPDITEELCVVVQQGDETTGAEVIMFRSEYDAMRYGADKHRSGIEVTPPLKLPPGIEHNIGFLQAIARMAELLGKRAAVRRPSLYARATGRADA